MGTLLGLVHKLLGGSSPVTGYIGSLGILSSGLDLLQEGLATNGLPANKLEWMILLTSIGLRLAKDANKSNARNPTAEPVVVSSSALPAIAILVMAFGLTGCGKTVDQLMKVAHQAIDVGGKIYEDVRDNVDTAKQTLGVSPAPVAADPVPVVTYPVGPVGEVTVTEVPFLGGRP